MIGRALLTALCIAVGLSETRAASPLELWQDPDRTVYLYNTTNSPISFDGYQIASEKGRLDPAGWKSIADYVAGGAITEVIAALGPGGLTFGEANPGAGNLAELNLGGVGTLQGGAKFAIGKPLLPETGVCEVRFFYKLGGQVGGVESLPSYCIPEPSTFLLAALAGVGLLVMRRRRLLFRWGQRNRRTSVRLIDPRPILTHVVTAALVVSVAAGASAQTVFDDGGIHVVPGASPSLIIRNGPDSLPTTVQVTTGGDVAFLDVFDTSLLELSGGIISFANLHNSAQVLVNSGEIAHLTAYDSAQVTINDPSAQIDHLETHDFATAAVLSGNLSHIRAFDGSHVIVGGGAGVPTVTDVSGDDSGSSQQSSRVDLLSGQFGGVYAWGTGVTNMYGGLAQYARANGGTVNIFGGDVVGDVMASPSALNVFGGRIAEVSASDGTTSIWGGRIGGVRDYVPSIGDYPPPGASTFMVSACTTREWLAIG